MKIVWKKGKYGQKDRLGVVQFEEHEIWEDKSWCPTNEQLDRIVILWFTIWLLRLFQGKSSLESLSLYLW